MVCAVMSYLLIEMVVYRGASTFYFYTQWTFTLVIIYFLIATLISAHGCWTYSRRYVIENEEVARRLLERDFEANLPEVLISRTNENGNSVKLQNYHEQGENEQMAGFWGYTMQIVYQASGGASILTDLTFWFLLVPFADPEYLSINPVRGSFHSLNVVFLLLDTALNRQQFPFFRVAYFILWTFAYLTFQWILHACGLQQWPYPFLDLNTPSAPLWYFSMGLFHIPCYGMYSLIVKAKNSACSKFFPQSYATSC
ncbi:uncharacterized protein LOC109822543 [Asparagus officinalis]|uniref:uncharacterized protein LOC109822543 n=1 Tax=Asparagus officinalis TaxID=4686 RepID=UPI00098E60E4|nr:uncharacterized protein LOC109822543 [Asparagus officinalis]